MMHQKKNGILRVGSLILNIKCLSCCLELKDYYCPKRIDPPLKKVPATDAVMRQARVAARSARGPTAARSAVLLGTRAAMPPTNIAIDAT